MEDDAKIISITAVQHNILNSSVIKQISGSSKMKNLKLYVFSCFAILSLLFINSHVLAQLQPHEIVTQAIDKTLTDMNNPSLRVIQQGSHISRINFRPFDSLNPSDYDSRLFILDQDISKEKALNIWKKFRLKLQRNLMEIAKKAGYDSNNIGKLRSLTNFYPPEQLMKQFSSNEEAIDYFLRQGLYPNLAEVGEEGAEGLYSKFTKFIRQSFEKDGRVKVSQLIPDQSGEWKVIHKATAKAEHLIEGVAPKNITGFIQAAEHAIEETKKALKKGQHEIAEKQIKRVPDALKGARSLVNVSTESGLLEKMNSLENVFQQLKSKAFSDNGISAKEYLSTIDDIAKKLKPIESELLVETGALKGLKEAKNPKTRWLLKGLLENDNKVLELKSKLVILSDDAISKGLTKEFALWFGSSMLEFWNLKQLDDAIKKGEVGLSNIVIPSLLNYLFPPTTPFGWAMLFSEIYMATVSLAVQYVESTGYFALIQGQDCMDLIAGIYTLKGREHRIFEKKCEEIVDSERLACRIYDHHGLRKHLLSGKSLDPELVPPLLNIILKCHADNASIHYDEMNQSKHDERISRALVEKCTPIILNEWYEARQIVVNDMDLLRQSLAELELKMTASPAKITKKSKISLNVDENNIDILEREIKEKIKCLGGIHAIPKFNRSYKWYVNGKEFATTYINTKDFIAEKEGNYELCVDAKYEWYVSGLPKVSLEDGISGNVIKKVCHQVVFLDEDKKSCTYTYTDWSPCDPNTKQQTRRLISKEPKGCIEKKKPVLEQPCTPDSKEDERARLERERLERERQERERLERERQEAERRRLEEERKKEPPTCVYEYSDWGECVRVTKKQTRTVIAKKPDGCVERQKLELERGCTPPPTEEEKRIAYLNCLCTYQTPFSMAKAYYASDANKSECSGSGPCKSGSLLGACRLMPLSTDPERIKSCASILFGKSDLSDNELKNALEIAKQENRKHMKPLEIIFNYDKCPIYAQLGDIINFSANIEGGIPPHTVSWSGEGEAKDNKFIFAKTRQPGTYIISATVNDSDGNSATASCQVIVDAVTVEIEKTSPKENMFPIGTKASFRAIVKSGKSLATGSFIYRWQPHPEVQFGTKDKPEFETTSPNTTAAFTKMGRFPIWVQVLKKIGETYQTVGESNQIEIDVIQPKLKLSANKLDPLVGEKVVTTVHEEPKMDDKTITFWWEYSGNVLNPGAEPNIPNSRSYSFKPKDIKPVTITAHAKAIDGGDNLGEAKITINPKSYTVAISEPRYHGPKPRIWKCDTQLGGACPGLVEVADTQFAVFRDIFTKATVTPNPESPRYRWSIDPAGSCGLPGAGSEIKINCSNTGTYTAKVEVTNADGIKLGEATQTVTISISEEMLTASNKAKEAHEKLQKAKGLVNEGKLDEAINLANEAAGLDPKNTEAKTLKDKWSKDREQITRHIDNINKFIKDKKFPEAERELQGAKSLHPKYAKVIEAEKALNEAKQRHQKEVTDRLNEAKRLTKEGKIDEAVSIVQEVAKIDKPTAQPVMNEISVEAKKVGWDALSKGDYKTAIKRLEQAVALNPADTDAQNKLKGAKDYEAKMPLVESKMKEFDKLIEEKKVVSSYQKLLEVQDILRTMTMGQSSYNPVIIKYNEEYNKLNKWYNELIQKTNAEFTRLFNEQDWVKAEALLKDVLRYEHTEANKRQYESSLQMVQNNLRERREAMQYYEQAKANNTKGQPSDIKGIEDVTRELRNRTNKFKPNEPEYKQMQELIAEMEKRKKAIAAVEYAKTTFLAGDQFYRAYQYGNAAVKYDEGLKSIRDYADTNSQLYVEYFTKWKDAVAKDSRYREIVNSLSNLLKNERLDETSIRNGIAMAEEGLKLVPNSSELGGSLYRLKIKLSEIQKQKELETQKKATADRLWDECSALARQNRLSDALAKCKESLNYWSNDKRVAVVRDIENSINQETQKKAISDRLWDECSALARQNRLNEALAKCKESLNYWSSDKRVAVVRDIENTINQEAQKKAISDRLWDECSALAKQNRLNDALAKCKESLNYWSSDKRVAVVNDIESKLKQPPIPPTKPPTTTGTATDSMTNKSKGYWRLIDRKSETKKGSDCYPVDVAGDEGNIIVNMKSVCGENGIVRVRAEWTIPPERLIPNENLRVDAVLIPELISGTNRGIAEEMEIKFDNADINCGYTTAGRIKIIEGYAAGVGHSGGKRSGEVKVPEKGRFKPDNLLKLSVCSRYYHQYYTYQWTEYTSGIGSSTNATTTMPTNISGNTQVIFNNGNIAGVYNNPTKPTTFTINQPHVITLIQNYHWNNAKGSVPGTIQLRDQNGRTYGPWQAKGSPGQGGVPNAYWTVYPNITIPAGTYTVIDSEPSTWAQNSGSQGAGFTRVEGYPAGSSSSQQTTGQFTGNIPNQSQKTITAEFKNSSGNQNIHIFAEGQDSFGPHNRITPGATIKVNIKAPSHGGFIKFAAGRNGQVLATCKWEYDPNTISGRMPVVTFHEPNRLSCVTGIR